MAVLSVNGLNLYHKACNVSDELIHFLFPKKYDSSLQILGWWQCSILSTTCICEHLPDFFGGQFHIC